ncbi:thioredoxin-disulfide reductase [Peptococcus simiae]|uniref:thioredoxin-disulfide reductase n=1 Tax=Peptococcus simiae TaxID=1643805 RepID=UPI0039814B4D
MARKPLEEKNYDLIILGAGPAGLAAGIYGGRAKMNTLIVEKGSVGGRAFTTREIVNYPGFPDTTGPELTGIMRDHAEKFGCTITKEAVKTVDFSDDLKVLTTRKHKYTAPAVIIATGTEARVLGIPGEKEFTGDGVAYCATCDAEFFQDQHVVVVGSGDQAIEEGMFIAKFAEKITVIVLHEEGILDCNKQAAERAFKHPKMNFIWNSVLDAIYGEDSVEGVKVKNVKTGEISDLACQGVFFFVGLVPQTAFLEGTGLETSSRGYIPTTDLMETNLEGIYAVGDVRDKYLRQIATAVGDGATAATAAERFIEEQKDIQENIMNSEKPLLLSFWTPDYDDSLEKVNAVDKVVAEAGLDYKTMEADYTRKKTLASKFDVELNDDKHAAVIIIKDGKKTGELDLAGNIADQLK